MRNVFSVRTDFGKDSRPVFRRRQLAFGWPAGNRRDAERRYLVKRRPSVEPCGGVRRHAPSAGSEGKHQAVPDAPLFEQHESQRRASFKPPKSLPEALIDQFPAFTPNAVDLPAFGVGPPAGPLEVAVRPGEYFLLR